MGDVYVRKLLREADSDYPVWAIFTSGIKKPELLIEELEMQHIVRTYLTEHPTGRMWAAKLLDELTETTP